MVRRAAMSRRAMRPEEEQVRFFIEGQRFEGRPGESLLTALVRLDGDDPGLLARLTASSGGDWRGGEGFARYETVLDSGETAIASPAHFTVRAGQHFRRNLNQDETVLTRERGTRLANALRRYINSLRKSVAGPEPSREPAPVGAPLERMSTEIAVIGGGAWGLALARKLAEAGRKVALVHQGSIDEAETPALALLPFAEAISASSEGEIWVEQRVGYERLRIVALRAAIIVFATGAYERPLPMPGLKAKGVMPLGLVSRLFRDWGYLPGGKVVAAVSGETAFLEVLALREAGMELALVTDTRMPDQQISLDKAMVAGVRIASANAPLAAVEHERALRLRIGNPFADEDKFAREEMCDVLLLSGGIEPRLRLFLGAGGRLSKGRPVAGKTAQGTWLVPVGGLAGERSFTTQAAAEMAAELTVLALNRHKEHSHIETLPPMKDVPAERLCLKGPLGYGEALEAEDLTLLRERTGGHGGLAAMELKLRREFAAAATAPSFLAGEHLPLEALFRGVRTERGVPFSTPTGLQDVGKPHWLAAAYGESTRWKKIRGKAVPFRCEDGADSGFLDVTGIIDSGRASQELVLLALSAILPDDLAAHCTKPLQLGACGRFLVYSARSGPAAERLMQAWRKDLPLVGLEEVLRTAFSEREGLLFQLLGEGAYGLERRPVAFYAQTGHGGLPQPGERFFANAHAREAVALVLASSSSGGGVIAVHPLANSLPAELYSQIFRQSFRRIDDQA